MTHQTHTPQPLGGWTLRHRKMTAFLVGVAAVAVIALALLVA